MSEILHQLGDLFLAAVPTVVIVFFFYLLLRWSFFLPIERVLAKRKALIEGSRREAEALRVQALEKQRADQEALRQARSAVFGEQEATRRAALDERSTLILQARSRATEEVHAAKKRIASEVEAARGEMEASGNMLAEQIVQALLANQPLEPASGAR